MTSVPVVMVYNVHLPVVVHPQFAHNDVVNRRRHFAPRVVISSFRKNKVGDSCQQNNTSVNKYWIQAHKLYKSIVKKINLTGLLICTIT